MLIYIYDNLLKLLIAYGPIVLNLGNFKKAFYSCHKLESGGGGNMLTNCQEHSIAIS